MKTLYRKMCNVEMVLSAICLLTTVFIIFGSALLRTVGKPIIGAWDIALLLFTWGAFLGADVAFREDKMVSVDLLFVKLPKNVQKPLQLVIYLIIFIFLCALVVLGSSLSVSTWHRSFQGIPGLSYTWVTLSIPVCSLSMIISIVIKVYKRFILKEQRVTEITDAL